MTYKNVINAINKGLSVYWFNTNYKIIKDNDRYLIHSQSNNHYIGFEDSNYYLKDCFIKKGNKK